MSLTSERGVVQGPLVEYARESGWTYIDLNEALRLRRGETGSVFHDVLVEKLQELNPGVVDLGRAEELVERIVRVPPTIGGNLEAWEYLRGLKTVFVPEEKRERNVCLLDLEQIDRNTFHVTDEFSFTNGVETVRVDVVFLVNGIPVILVETKAATRAEGMGEAFDQVARYHREAPELMALFQLQTLTHLIRFLYGATWNFSIKSSLRLARRERRRLRDARQDVRAPAARRPCADGLHSLHAGRGRAQEGRAPAASDASRRACG
jgi:type I restriction enzyme R subunit